MLLIEVAFVSEEENKAHSYEEAINGAKDIIAENISDNADFRKVLRKNTFFDALIKTEKIKDNHVFEMYYDYSESVRRIASHRILAINRGENEGVLRVKLIDPVERNIEYLTKRIEEIHKNLLKTKLMLNIRYYTSVYQRTPVYSVARDHTYRTAGQSLASPFHL